MTDGQNSPQPTRPRAVLYQRLSRQTLESTSLIGQSEDLGALAEREGWDVVATFVDEGLSGGKRRANADEALRMLREGEADVLAAYSVDRYSRMGIGEDAEVIRVIDAREEQARRGHGIRPLAYFAREGIRSDSGSDWRLRYALSSEMARSERDVMVSRRKRSIHQLQAQGRFSGRGVPPWGYRSAPHPSGAGRTLVVDPTEAAVIREAAERLLAGESATSVANDLTRRGIPTPRGEARRALVKGEPIEGLASGFWGVGNLVAALQTPSITGRIARGTHSHESRGRQGSYVLAEDGNPLQAFEPVLSAATFAALHERFPRGQGRGSQRKRKAARLGSGLVFCQCGAKAYVLTSASYTYYRCSAKSIGRVDCPGQSLQASAVEEAITEDFLGAFGKLQAVERVESLGAPEVADSVAMVTERIRSLTSAMAEPGADIMALVGELTPLQAERDRLQALPVERTVTYRELGIPWSSVWAMADLDARRGLLERFYDHFEMRYPGAETRLVGRLKPSPEESPEYHGLK
ncbi:recombinase family protein [Microbacterium sp.]|uniref:recombinase family protein n=1 Tax=Microbacterium sp. TaxID=51671 RepID=UPI003565E65C